MTPERWARVEALFHEALALPPSEHTAFLAARAADDPDVLREVQLLLASDATQSNLVDEALGDRDKAAAELVSRLSDTQVGPYRLLDLIGRGGMGSVYRAERSDGEPGEWVAIKLVRADLESPKLVARFRAERQILASLIHPNIARLIDGGMASFGSPYFVMEYVDGVPVTEYCQQLDLGERLKLFRVICGAVEYAHRHLVVNRDIKPSNVLVTENGIPKLLDFGIARLLSPEGIAQPGMTVTGDRFLTPEHAAPEQILNQRITTATDVYALGVLLYEILTGAPPFRRTTSVFELERQICEVEPARPSHALAARAPREAKRLRGDLDSIVTKALQKDPERRYGSVERLSADVDMYLQGLPVEARGESGWYRGRKFVRRHRWGIAIGLPALAAAIVMGLGLSQLVRVLPHQPYVRASAKRLGATGMALDARGLYREAEAALGLALWLESRVVELGFGPQHGVFIARCNAARVLGHQGNLLEAESEFRRAVTIDQPAGANALELADARSGLAEVRHEQGAWREAESLYYEALAVLAKAPQRDRLAEARAVCGLGGLLVSEAASDDGVFDDATLLQAEALPMRCLATRNEMLGVKDSQTAEALAALARLRYRQHRVDEGNNLSRQAIAIDWDVFPGGHPQTASHLIALGRRLLAEGSEGEAEPLLREAADIRRQFFPAGAWRIAEAEYYWAQAISATGAVADAAPILERTTASLLRSPGPDAEATRLALRTPVRGGHQ